MFFWRSFTTLKTFRFSLIVVQNFEWFPVFGACFIPPHRNVLEILKDFTNVMESNSLKISKNLKKRFEILDKISKNL